MKHWIVFGLLSAAAFAYAQEGKVTVTADPKLGKMEDSFRKTNKKYPESEGCRVLVLQTSDRLAALKVKEDLQKKFPDFQFYLDYQQPYFRLKVGNFHDRFEALNTFEKVKSLYPQAIIVNERVDLMIDQETPDQLRENSNDD